MDTTFAADPTRLVIAALCGLGILLFLIIKAKFQPLIAILLSALGIGLIAGMPVSMITDTVTKGMGETLKGIALLVGLGSMFGANGAIGGMDVYTLLTKAVLIIICCIASTELPKRLFVTAAGKMNEKAAFAVKSVLTLALLALSFVFLIGDSYNPFLYFRF